MMMCDVAPSTVNSDHIMVEGGYYLGWWNDHRRQAMSYLPSTASAPCNHTPPSTAPAAATDEIISQGKQGHNDNDPLSDIHHILGAKLRVTMTDGRVAHGTFVGLDRLCNIIMDNVIEYREIAYMHPNQSHPSDGVGVSGVEDDGEGGIYSSGNDNNDRGHNPILESQEFNNNTSQIYRWNTERSLSQAVIRGDRLAKFEIAKEEWTKRTGRSTV